MLLPTTLRPLIGAHRGASADAPENTLAAFDLAVDQGAELIELDVQRTRDDALVIQHDFSLGRTTTGAGLLAEHTLAELRALDAGVWRGDSWAEQRIPTLDEVLDRYGARVYLNLEIKIGELSQPGIEQQVAAAVSQRGLYDRIVVSSFDSPRLVGSARSIRGCAPPSWTRRMPTRRFAWRRRLARWDCTCGPT